MQRNMTRDSSFSEWMNKQKARDENGGDGDADSGTGLLSQLAYVQDGLAQQMSDFSGALPDAGPLNADFRARLSTSVYLMLASITFGVIAIFVGLPIVALRPSKFIMCMTLSTLLGASSVAVMKKPSVFFSELVSGPLEKSIPLIAVFISCILTIYVTVTIHRYLYIIAAGGFQLLCMLWYIASFIPGGYAGLRVLLQACYYMVRTAMMPCIAFGKYAVSRMLS